MLNYRPLFRYPGSKWRLMPQYLELFPQHDHYVSVFGGSATDLFRKPRSARETLNDLDPKLYALFKVLQDDHLTEQLKRKVTIPHCRQLFCDALNAVAAPITDPVKTAAAFLIVTGQGMCSSHRRKNRETAWTAHRLPEHLKHWLRMPETIDLDRQRLTAVAIRNEPWLSIIQEMDSPTAFFFLDPPYYLVDPLYAVTMSPGEHWNMLKTLLRIEGRAMLCGYGNSLYDKVLAGWYRKEFDVKTTLDIQGNRVQRKEVIWRNYDPATTQLWTP